MRLEPVARLLAGVVAPEYLRAPDVGGEGLDQKGRNFIAMLAENKRLPFLPEISQLFDALKADAERVVEVSITSPAINRPG